MIPYTDAVVTNVKNVLLTTVHADCLAVYFYDEKNQAIGLAHAGWRGTAAGISIKTLEKMKEVYGSKAEDMQVYIGPGISRCCFETGPEVYREFKESWDFIDEFAEERYVLKYSQDVKPQIGLSDSKMNLPERESVLKYYLDNKGLNKRQLEISGVKPENIKVSRHCTCCETDLFCSYRREGGTYMRMGAGLCLI